METGQDLTESTGYGTLYVVGTPIGNLEDLTERGRSILLSVPVVVCEDTRRTGRLLKAIGAKARLISCFEHKEARCAREVVGLLAKGTSCAFCTDAGTPNVSDPGRRLLAQVLDAGMRVVPVPGVSAVTALLSCCPFDVDRFYFMGFLPEKPARRRELLKDVSHMDCPLVFFEAPHRLKGSLRDIQECLGDREIFMGREMTKMHEEVRLSRVKDLIDYFDRYEPKGEFTFCIKGWQGENTLHEDIIENVRELLELVASGLTHTKAISKALSRITGVSSRRIYELIVSIKHRIKEKESNQEN